MRVKSRHFSLNNVIGFEKMLNSDNDVFDQIAHIGSDFKELLIQNGYYSNGPIILVYNPFDSYDEVVIMTTVGNKINLIGENKSDFFYKEHVDFHTNYFYRHYDQEERIPYKLLKGKIESDNRFLLTIYHVLLDLDGDIVVDLYCEVDEI